LPDPTLDEVFTSSVTLHQAGRIEQASNGYRRVLAAAPHHAATMAYLGMARAQAKGFAEAVVLLRRATALWPEEAAVHNNLGNALKGKNAPAAAQIAFRRSLALAPGFCAPHFNIAVAEPRLDRRISSLERSVACEPSYKDALVSLIPLYDRLGKAVAAGSRARRAIAVAPQDAAALSASSDHVLARGQPPRASLLAQRALATGVDAAAAMYRLAAATEGSGDLDDAFRRYRQSLALDPAYAASHVALGSLELSFGYAEEAVTAYGRAMAASADLEEAEGNRVFALAFVPQTDPQALVRANRRWAAARAGSVRPSVKSRPRRPGRLRIGYVSPEFVKHGFMLHFLPMLRRHDRSRYELFAYSQTDAFDRWSAEVKHHVEHWRAIGHLSVEDQSAVVVADEIDILVNLTGYIAHQRALFFRRSAPVQIAYGNHIGPTGIAAIDARISDAWLEPEGASFLDAEERLIRLDTGYLAYGAPEAPEVDGLPAIRNGFITFGVFNNIAKVSRPALAAWARILSRVPGSRLLLKGFGLTAARARDRISRILGSYGIDVERVEMVGRVPGGIANLATVARADVALDPFPFSGGMSTLDALWMGLPVVSVSGPGFVHRIGLTHLTRSGFGDFVVADVEAYVERAVSLASNLDTLAVLRRDMRSRLLQSLLFDAGRHARELESAYDALAAEHQRSHIRR